MDFEAFIEISKILILPALLALIAGYFQWQSKRIDQKVADQISKREDARQNFEELKELVTEYRIETDRLRNEVQAVKDQMDKELKAKDKVIAERDRKIKSLEDRVDYLEDILREKGISIPPHK